MSWSQELQRAVGADSQGASEIPDLHRGETDEAIDSLELPARVRASLTSLPCEVSTFAPMAPFNSFGCVAIAKSISCSAIDARHKGTASMYVRLTNETGVVTPGWAENVKSPTVTTIGVTGAAVVAVRAAFIACRCFSSCHNARRCDQNGGSPACMTTRCIRPELK